MKGFLAGLLASISLTLGNLLGTHKNLVPALPIAINNNNQSASAKPQDAKPVSRLSGIGNTLGKFASVLGTQTVRTGQDLVNNLTSTPSSQTDVVDMASVVHDISSKVESIPGNLVNQAKIEYCRQVLLTATASATKK